MLRVATKQEIGLDADVTFLTSGWEPSSVKNPEVVASVVLRDTALTVLVVKTDAVILGDGARTVGAREPWWFGRPNHCCPVVVGTTTKRFRRTAGGVKPNVVDPRYSKRSAEFVFYPRSSSKVFVEAGRVKQNGVEY